MILISSIILLNLSLIFFFYRIGEFVALFELNKIKSIIFGYSIFLILTYYFYFTLRIDVEKILIIWSTIFLILIILFVKNIIRLKKKIIFDNFLIILIFLISTIYILPAYLYGEQFYVFRGNHWDLFSYTSIGSLFNNYDFSFLLKNENFPLEYKHFNHIEQLIFSRPLTSLLIAIYIQIFDLDVFLITYLFKISLILLSAISFKNLIDNIKISQPNKIILTLSFTLSFWLIYIFEIEAISHLASLPIFLLIMSEVNNIDRFKKFDFSYIFYLSIINSALFLIYPELFCVSSIICGIFFLEKLFKSDEKKNFIKSITFVLFLFFFLTIPSYKTNYIFLLSQLDLSLNANKDWWGYFGSFILGKDNLVQNQSYVIQIKDYFLNNNLFETIKYIISLHFETGYQFFYINIIPSFFGLYFISIGKISSFLDWLNLIFLISLTIFLINITIRNFLVLKKNNGILLSFLSLFVFSIFVLIKGNLWTLIKLYTFLSPFIFIFIVINFYKNKNDDNLNINFLIIFFLICFPIYKYSSSNYGIGKLDSFPSVMHSKMKTSFKWELLDKDFTQCSYIDVEIDDYFKKSYILLKFLEHQTHSNLINNKDINLDNKCYLIEENNKFKILLNSYENRNNNL